MAGKKTIWDLALNIAGQDKGATAAIKTVKKQLGDLQAATKQLGQDWKAFTGNAAKLAMGVAGGAAAATAGIMSMANSFADAGDKVLKASAATGIGVEAYQELQYAMGKSGVSAESFDAALQKFNLTVRQGAAGNAAAAKQLEAVGLSAEKLSKMAPEQAMMRLSDYMKSLPNDAERTRVAVQLFGKSAGPEMMAALKQGSEAIGTLRDESRRATFTFSKDQAEISRQFQNTKSDLMGSFENVKFSFIAGSMGPVTEALKTLQETVLSSVPSISDLGEKFGKWLGDMVKRLPEIIAQIKEFGLWVKNTAEKVVNFVGGFKNLAKILAGLAVAPTLISGMKVLFSLGKLVHTAIGAIGPLLGGLSGGFGAMAAAALPVIGIVAGIAAVIYTVVRNFDTLKAYALDCIDRIKSAFSGGASGVGTDWKSVGEVFKTIAGIIEKVVLLGIVQAMNVLTSTIQIVVGAIKTLWNIAKLVFWPIETIIKVIAGFIEGGFAGGISALTGQFKKLGDIVGGIFGGIKAMIGGVVDLIKGTVDAVKGFFGGVGEKIGGLFGKNKGVDLQAHAAGGIFTHRHIAEIAEKGAEAVVPLNKSPQGYDIWKKAGEIGGYLQASEAASSAVGKTEAAKTAAQSTSAAEQITKIIPFPVKEITDSIGKTLSSGVAGIAEKIISFKSAGENNGGQPQEAPPIAKAASEKMAAGENVIHVTFSQAFTFNGGPQDAETVKSIKESGQQAADDFAAKLDEVMRNRKRLAYA